MKIKGFFLIFLLVISTITLAPNVLAAEIDPENIIWDDELSVLEKLNQALARIESLEKEIAELKKPQKEVKTEKLLIVDNKGEIYAQLFYDQELERTHLYMNDIDGKRRIEITSCDPEFSHISFYDKNNLTSVGIFSQSFIPSISEWNLLKFVADNNSDQYLTDNLIMYSIRMDEKWSFSDNEITRKLQFYVNTRPQPNWDDYYLGNGKFSLQDRELRAEYTNAGYKIITLLTNYIDVEELKRYDYMNIDFSIYGSEVGTWTNGEMKLKGEL